MVSHLQHALFVKQLGANAFGEPLAKQKVAIAVPDEQREMFASFF